MKPTLVSPKPTAKLVPTAAKPAAKPATPQAKPGIKPAAKPATSTAPAEAPQPEAKRGPGRPPKASTTVAQTATAEAHDVSTLLARLASAEAEAKRMTEALAKAEASFKRANGNERPRRDVVTLPESISGVRADDWRLSWQGWTIECNEAHYKRKGDADSFFVGKNRTIALCAIPRDNDVGGHGGAARNLGLLALHFDVSEDGSMLRGEPFYVALDNLEAMNAEGIINPDGEAS